MLDASFLNSIQSIPPLFCGTFGFTIAFFKRNRLGIYKAFYPCVVAIDIVIYVS